MLRATLLSAILLIAIGLFVKTAIAPKALREDGKPSTADLTHPPTPYGASAVTSAPTVSRR